MSNFSKNMTAGLQTLARDLGGDDKSFCSESDSFYSPSDEPPRKMLQQQPPSSFTPPTT